MALMCCVGSSLIFVYCMFVCLIVFYFVWLHLLQNELHYRTILSTGSEMHTDSVVTAVVEVFETDRISL